jgi:two-component system sensor histidine kinase BaeS
VTTDPASRPVEGRSARTRPLPSPVRPGTLRTRLTLAFAAVAAAAIALVAGAAMIGTDRGLSAQFASDRQQFADRAADAAARAYLSGGGWDGADLGAALTVASGTGARVVIRELDGDVVATTGGQGLGNGMGYGPGNGMGMGYGPGNGMGMGKGRQGGNVLVSALVRAGGSTVGTVTLVYPPVASTARPVAWTWVGAAAGVALAVALAAAWLITRMLTRPLAVLTTTARSFAAGDRSARTNLDAGGELGELAAAFDAAAAQIEHSERARRQLSADVAHELRTPLAALQAGLEELRDGLVPADAATLARLHDQTLRLGRVVTDLAELSAADAARLTLRRVAVDLADVAAAAAAEHEAPLRTAGLALSRDLEPVTVDGDALRLHQVVGNLLQNCARHCRLGDTVTLTVRAVPGPPGGRGGQARLTVSDTGPGIPPQDLPNVFTRFWRGDGGGGGSGLGMAIVRSLVEAHGGSVAVDSDGRTGTTVTVLLPTRTTVPRDGGRHETPAAPSRIA